LIATGTTTGNDNNTISNNIVRDRTDVVGVPANLIASLNASITATNSNNVITGNQLTNFTANGFATSSAVTSDNWTITNNDISQTAARTTTIFGINTGGPAGTNLISGNSIHGFNTNGANTSLGILIGNASNLTISRNRIYDFQTTAGATGVIEGMEFDGASGTTATVNVVNNMVSLAPTLATAQPIIGIQDFGFGGNVFTANYNSIYIGGTATGAASSWALRRGTGAPTTYTARNNIAFNNRTGGTGNHFAGGDQSANTGTFVSNYNIFVGTGATAANFFDYGTSSTGTPVNFAAWQAGPPTRDANSQASNPGGNYTLANFFISATDLHLNTTGTNPAISAGTPVGGVTTDFDNDPRPASNPDIGADEVVMATGGTLAAGTYYNVSTANGDTLGGDVTVTNQLTLNGVLNTGSFTLTMDCGASVVGAGASSYVIGNVRKNYCVNGSFTYPVGTANGYSPVDATITLIINPSSLMVKAVQGARPGLNASTSLQRYWTLTETSGDLTANLTFNYLNDPNPPNPQNTNDVMGNEANYRIIRVEGSTFTNFPNNCPSPCVDATANTATVNGVNNFSDWTLGEPDAPTAVRLRSFAARRTENGVLLEWDSGFEVDNLGYNIYREQNGVRVLVTPSLVAGSALKTGPGTQLTAGMSYAWWDMNASASAQYWLEDVDLEGKNTMYGPFTQQAASGTARPVASTLLSELTAGKSGAAASAAQREWPAAIDAQSPKSVSAINRAETSSLEQQFGLAGQAAVKLSVNQDGWYRVTGAELVAAGLDANADSTRLQLYLNGEELPIKVGADGTVEFYGRRLDAPATDRNVYWLIEGTTPGQRIQMLPVLPAGAQFATGFPVTVERQDKMIYFASLQNGEASNIFGPVVNSQSATQALQLRHLDGAANSPAQLEVALQGVTSQSHLVSVTLNGQQVGVVSFTGREHAVWQVPVPMNALAEGENIVTLSRMNGDGDTSLVDYVRVTYARTYQAEANQLACTVAAGSTVKLGGFTTDDIRVIDVSDASQPRELSVTAEPDGLGFAVSFDVAAAAQLLAFTGSSPMQQPAAMVANEPSAWNGLRHGANMVMITHRDFRQAVEPLAAHRRQQGLSVVVIDVEDIYDEFSYSAHGPQAIKDFLEWTHQHWPASPQYVLLVGDSSWDARNELSLTQSEYVPTKLVDTTYMETASDDWLADFNNDGIAEMGIGRLPVKTAGQAATIVQKIIAYDQLRFDPRRGAMLVADNGFEAMSADIHSVIPDRMPVQIINRSSASDPVIRQQILDGINAGPRIVNYYGHGSIQVWTGAGLLQNSDANNLTNGSKLAVFTLMNCLNGYAHDAYIDSLGEALLKAENGGAVAVWASSGYTEPGGQAQVNRQLYQQVFTDSAVRLGDAIRSAKGATTNPDVRRTWVLLGDPSMRVK
jgi:hypothetical protein